MSVKFSDIKLLYQLIVGRKVSNGTIADLLKRLLKKGVLKRVGESYHLVVDFETAMSVIVERLPGCSRFRGTRVWLRNAIGGMRNA